MQPQTILQDSDTGIVRVVLLIAFMSVFYSYMRLFLHDHMSSVILACLFCLPCLSFRISINHRQEFLMLIWKSLTTLFCVEIPDLNHDLARPPLAWIRVFYSVLNLMGIRRGMEDSQSILLMTLCIMNFSPKVQVKYTVSPNHQWSKTMVTTNAKHAYDISMMKRCQIIFVQDFLVRQIRVIDILSSSQDRILYIPLELVWRHRFSIFFIL